MVHAASTLVGVPEATTIAQMRRIATVPRQTPWHYQFQILTETERHLYERLGFQMITRYCLHCGRRAGQRDLDIIRTTHGWVACDIYFGDTWFQLVSRTDEDAERALGVGWERRGWETNGVQQLIGNQL